VTSSGGSGERMTVSPFGMRIRVDRGTVTSIGSPRTSTSAPHNAAAARPLTAPRSRR
jgi:hypothetical protein